MIKIPKIELFTKPTSKVGNSESQQLVLDTGREVREVIEDLRSIYVETVEVEDAYGGAYSIALSDWESWELDALGFPRPTPWEVFSRIETKAVSDRSVRLRSLVAKSLHGKARRLREQYAKLSAGEEAFMACYWQHFEAIKVDLLTATPREFDLTPGELASMEALLAAADELQGSRE